VTAPHSRVPPFLKWPGGKRWLGSGYAYLFPETFDRYIEPFLGSGAVFFALRPKKATLGDINQDVVGAFSGIKADWAGVERRLRKHQSRHSDSYYYRIRAESPSDPTERAAWFLYLNRTCFNGIYRVNRLGEFNVPVGTKSSVVLPTDDFEAVARLLQKARLVRSDFEHLVDSAGRRDLIFADPPYTVRHNNNAFVKYNERLFSWADQERLAESLRRAKRRGVKIVLTNADHRCIRDLYDTDGFHLQKVSRFSPISASADGRGRYSELVITANI
jgi:DNA adenine methylase